MDFNLDNKTSEDCIFLVQICKELQVIKNSGGNARSVVYTALFGNYDSHDDPKANCNDIDYVCFTDIVREGSKWTQIKVNIGKLSCITANRFFKMHPHLLFSGYRFSIYVDANIKIEKCPCDLINKIPFNTSFAAFAHPERNTLLFEGLACVAKRKSRLLDTATEISKYYQLGYTEQNSLTANYVLILRQNDQGVVKLMEYWWSLFGLFTKRDQISLPFCLWKQKIKIKRFSNTEDEIEAYFSFKPHCSHESQTRIDNYLRKLDLLTRYVLLSPIYFIMVFFKFYYKYSK